MDAVTQEKIQRIMAAINRTNDRVNEINMRIDQLMEDGEVTDPVDPVDYTFEELHTALDQIEGSLVMLEQRLQHSFDRLQQVH